MVQAHLHRHTGVIDIDAEHIFQLRRVQIFEIDTGQTAQVGRFTTSHRGWFRRAFVGQLVERKLLCFGVDQQVRDFTLGFQLAIFVHIQAFTVEGVCRLLQCRCHQRVTHIHIGLPFVVRVRLARVLCFGVIDRGQVTIAPFVIHGQSGALVVRSGVVAVERFGHHLRIGWKVQAQLHQRSFFRHARGFLRDGQHVQVTQIGFAGRVD